MKINYKIEMLSDWHIGSGLDSGTNADALVLKDEKDLPYISGKTLKGLLKDALMDINEVQPTKVTLVDINRIFGEEIKNEKGEVIRTKSGCAFFSNAYLKGTERQEIITHQLADHLYRNISSTAIGRKNHEGETAGIAKAKSLRTMQVSIPVTLYSNITITDLQNIDKSVFETIFELAFKWMRYLGVNRNRGLGRCKFLEIKS